MTRKPLFDIVLPRWPGGHGTSLSGMAKFASPGDSHAGRLPQEMPGTMPRSTDQFTPSGFDATDEEPVTEARDLDAELVARELAREFQIVRLLGRGAMGSV